VSVWGCVVCGRVWYGAGERVCTGVYVLTSHTRFRYAKINWPLLPYTQVSFDTYAYLRYANDIWPLLLDK